MGDRRWRLTVAQAIRKYHPELTDRELADREFLVAKL